jgi:hypothetical protein
MILSIHQPNFIPWLGYFDKIQKSDVFVILDTVQYPRGKSIANRNSIKSGNAALELVLPVSIPKGNDGMVLYPEVQFAENNWSKKMLKTIQMAYSKSPHFQPHFDDLNNLWQNTINFCEMNILYIKHICKIMGIDTQLVLLSEIKNKDVFKNDLIIHLCHELNCTTYLSGNGASKYNNESLMNENNITLEYQTYQCPIYKQLGNDFIPNLSVIDYLFNEGSTNFETL